MSDTVIQVENLGKKYIIGHQQQERYTALRDVIANGAKSLGQRLLKPWGKQSANPAYEEFWALKDVSFEVKQGDRIGIIGRNGAGKSTLLKILSRITEPTTGKIRIKGRVASLLEVGTGFHPELTGRENIFLNGAILGMSKAEIKSKFDEIVDFAGIERFLDTPVKRYSSGMYVRLAFAVAAHLEPEILIVDEVLAVGDAQFQKKCLGKMEEVGREGRTVVFVSHKLGSVTTLTQHCLYLEEGKILACDETAKVIEFYTNRNLQVQLESIGNIKFYRKYILSDSPVYFINIYLESDKQKGEIVELQVNQAFIIFLTLEVKREVYRANIAINIKKSTGDIVTTILAWDSEYRVDLEVGITTLECRIEELNLLPGLYLLDVGINQSTQTKAWDVIVDYPAFRVINYGNSMIIHRSNRTCAILCNKVTWRKVS